VNESNSALMARFYKQVEDAYIYANKTLLKLMLEEQELIPHLR
jgi:gamma-tubulin complex component 2